jgi:hypothetical protein
MGAHLPSLGGSLFFGTICESAPGDVFSNENENENAATATASLCASQAAEDVGPNGEPTPGTAGSP